MPRALKLGLELSEATVAKFMVHHRKPPTQTWRTFLANHMKDMVSSDFLVVSDRVLSRAIWLRDSVARPPLARPGARIIPRLNGWLINCWKLFRGTAPALLGCAHRISLWPRCFQIDGNLVGLAWESLLVHRQEVHALGRVRYCKDHIPFLGAVALHYYGLIV